MSDFPLLAKLFKPENRLTALLSAAGFLGLLLLWGLMGGQRNSPKAGPEGLEAELALRMGMETDLPALEQETFALERSVSGITAQLLPESNPALASAFLQNRIKKTIQSTGLGVKSVRMGEPKEVAGPFWRVGMNLECFGNIKGIMKFIHAVEKMDRPLAAIERLEISKPDLRTPEVYNLRVQIYSVLETNESLK